MPSSRGVKEGPQPQGVNETIHWQIDVKPPAVTGGTVTVMDTTTATDVTAGTVAGPSLASGGMLLLPALSGLEAGHNYRVAARYGDGASTLEVYILIEAEA